MSRTRGSALSLNHGGCTGPHSKFKVRKANRSGRFLQNNLPSFLPILHHCPCHLLQSFRPSCQQPVLPESLVSPENLDSLKVRVLWGQDSLTESLCSCFHGFLCEPGNSEGSKSILESPYDRSGVALLPKFSPSKACNHRQFFHSKGRIYRNEDSDSGVKITLLNPNFVTYQLCEIGQLNFSVPQFSEGSRGSQMIASTSWSDCEDSVK